MNGKCKLRQEAYPVVDSHCKFCLLDAKAYLQDLFCDLDRAICLMYRPHTH